MLTAVLQHDALALLLPDRSLALAHRLGRVYHGKLGIAEDDEVERRSLVGKVVRPHGDVETGDRQGGLRMQSPHQVADGHRGGVLQAGGAGDDH